MIQFKATIHRFDKQGEKTGWSYLEIDSRKAQKLKPDCKLSFRVKGTFDGHAFNKTALLPMGDGNFILPWNATHRKATGKKHGDVVQVVMEADERELTLSPDLMKCLKADPSAMNFFKTLSKSHQQYFSKWIDSAKTMETKTKRIVMALEALGKDQGYSEMIRANKSKQE